MSDAPADRGKGRIMSKINKSEKVPNGLQEVFAAITSLSDDFCSRFLNDEYAGLIRSATAALCRMRPSPLVRGKANIWACGITHAIGAVNFLYDPTQKPFLDASVLYEAYGVKESTGQAKSRLVRDILDMSYFDPDWCLLGLLDQNPSAWLIKVDGFIVDARSMPREVQEIAYQKGLIPYIPDEAAENA